MIARADRVIADLGTGDGRAVLARAVAEPGNLIIGIDANAAAMAESSRRAARGGVTNALFLVEAVEALPGPLASAASLVTITMPWGSLLRGAVGLDRAVIRGIASIVAVGGWVGIIASVVPVDHVDGLSCLDARAEAGIRQAWAEAGFALESMRRATVADLGGTRSAWGRRLADRPLWQIALRRTDG